MSSTTNETISRTLASALAEDAGKRAGDHPRLDQLADYLASELTPDVESRIQDHLVACRACSDQLLDLETLSEPDRQTAPGVADLALAAAWREQRARIAAVGVTRRRQRTMRLVSALAASFFIAAIGLSAQVSQLRRMVAELGRPEINLPIAYLDASATRGETPPITIERGESDRSLVLTLTPTGSQSWPEYGVEVLSDAGSKVWAGRGLVRNDFGTLRLRMPRALLPTGDYEIRLDGLDGERRERLQTIPLLLRDH